MGRKEFLLKDSHLQKGKSTCRKFETPRIRRVIFPFKHKFASATNKLDGESALLHANIPSSETTSKLNQSNKHSIAL